MSDDVEKLRYSHCEWTQARETTVAHLDQYLKEPIRVLFFKGAIYECTFIEEGSFSQSQKCILLDLPSKDSLDNWEKVK